MKTQNIKRQLPLIIALSSAFVLSACDESREPETGAAKQETKPSTAVSSENGVHCPLCASDFGSVSTPIGGSHPKPAGDYLIALPGDNGHVNLSGLLDHNGQELTQARLQAELSGKIVVVYFGFPDCTWFCPPSTSAIMDALDAFQGHDIVPLFISSRTDPQTAAPYLPKDMKQWIESFGAGRHSGLGLTGSIEDLSRIYQKMQVIDEHGNHVPYLGIIDAEGTFLGGGKTITEHVDSRGKPFLRPAPQVLIKALGDRLGIVPEMPEDAPSP